MLRSLARVAAVMVSVLALGAAPASAHPRPAGYYLALGDSLAAGYQPDPTIGRDQGYVTKVYDALAHGRRWELRNLGCDGATTTTLLAGGGGCSYDGAASQLAAAERFLRLHPRRVDLITIDIGGNDLNHCAAGGTIDQACALAAIGTV